MFTSVIAEMQYHIQMLLELNKNNPHILEHYHVDMLLDMADTIGES